MSCEPSTPESKPSPSFPAPMSASFLTRIRGSCAACGLLSDIWVCAFILEAVTSDKWQVGSRWYGGLRVETPPTRNARRLLFVPLQPLHFILLFSLPTTYYLLPTTYHLPPTALQRRACAWAAVTSC